MLQNIGPKLELEIYMNTNRDQYLNSDPIQAKEKQDYKRDQSQFGGFSNQQESDLLLKLKLGTPSAQQN